MRTTHHHFTSIWYNQEQRGEKKVKKCITTPTQRILCNYHSHYYRISLGNSVQSQLRSHGICWKPGNRVWSYISRACNWGTGPFSQELQNANQILFVTHGHTKRINSITESCDNGQDHTVSATPGKPFHVCFQYTITNQTPVYPSRWC